MPASKPTPDYRAIARFRGALRAFEKTAEETAQAAGLTLQRYLLLLMIKGAPSGEERATVNDLAERMKLEPHTVTGLVTRAEQAGLVRREQCSEDRRRMWIRLTSRGEQRLDRVLRQLEARREELVDALEQATGNARALAADAVRRERRR